MKGLYDKKEMDAIRESHSILATSFMFLMSLYFIGLAASGMLDVSMDLEKVKEENTSPTYDWEVSDKILPWAIPIQVVITGCYILAPFLWFVQPKFAYTYLPLMVL